MVTLGLGILLRGLVQIAFADVPKGLALPVPTAPFVVGDLYVSSERLLAAVVASLAIAAVAWLQHRSRTGLALRAVADDQQAAMAVGIDVGFHHMLAWGAAGLVCVVAGILWALVTGGGIGLGLIGLKIFPIVIIGGLDSIAGTIVAAILIGVIESLATGYLEPYLGSGCAVLVTYGALLVMLLVRPAGLFGVRRIERV
jgi:branched-chain amino acid transport system permease protein